MRKYSSDPERDISNLPSAKRVVDTIPQSAWDNAKKDLDGDVVKVNMNSDIQKQFDNATPKERQKIAFNYIMTNLRGKYPAQDGRIIAIERVGADKLTYHNNEIKLRVTPELAALIQSGKFEGITKPNKDHKLFSEFAYYRVRFRLKMIHMSGY